jgi:cytochrome c-type biogenesis protein CcmH
VTLTRLWISLLLVLAGPTMAVIETYEFSDPMLELRYQELSAELRCPKCQNQNIADSNAPIAQDLRRQLHRQLEDGASDDEILDYMVARYGDFVRYRPSFEGASIILWLMPLVLLLAGGGVLVWTLRSRGAGEAPTALSEQERSAVERMLAEREESS